MEQEYYNSEAFTREAMNYLQEKGIRNVRMCDASEAYVRMREDGCSQAYLNVMSQMCHATMALTSCFVTGRRKIDSIKRKEINNQVLSADNGYMYVIVDLFYLIQDKHKAFRRIREACEKENTKQRITNNVVGFGAFVMTLIRHAIVSTLISAAIYGLRYLGSLLSLCDKPRIGGLIGCAVLILLVFYVIPGLIGVIKYLFSRRR